MPRPFKVEKTVKKRLPRGEQRDPSLEKIIREGYTPQSHPEVDAGRVLLDPLRNPQCHARDTAYPAGQNPRSRVTACPDPLVTYPG